MKKILLTAFVALGFIFAASAQQEPIKAKINKQAVASKKADVISLQKMKIEAENTSLQTSKPVQKSSVTTGNKSEVYKKD